MPIACVIFTCQRNHDVLKICVSSMAPLMEEFPTFIATDIMAEDQLSDLLTLNGANFSVYEAGYNASWTQVARHITRRLRADGFTTVISVLDDFFFFYVDKPLLRLIAGHVDEIHLQYVRLVNEKPRIGLVFSGKGRTHPGMNFLREIPHDNPYRHSLSLSLWNVSYFINLLARDISIWDFEIQRSSTKTALFYTPRSPCRYNHIVEKGSFARFAPALTIASEGINGGRSIESIRTTFIKWFRSNIIFFFIGYTIANRRFERSKMTRKL